MKQLIDFRERYWDFVICLMFYAWYLEGCEEFFEYIKSIASEKFEFIVFCYCDAEKASEIVTEYKIKSAPIFIFFKPDEPKHVVHTSNTCEDFDKVLSSIEHLNFHKWENSKNEAYMKIK